MEIVGIVGIGNDDEWDQKEKGGEEKGMEGFGSLSL